MRLTDDPGFDDRPSWSPDSNQIVFGSNRGGSMQLYVMNVDGSGLRQLTRQPGELGGRPGRQTENESSTSALYLDKTSILG